jgi:hypothetical protein
LGAALPEAERFLAVRREAPEAARKRAARRRRGRGDGSAEEAGNDGLKGRLRGRRREQRGGRWRYGFLFRRGSGGGFSGRRRGAVGAERRGQDGGVEGDLRGLEQADFRARLVGDAVAAAGADHVHAVGDDRFALGELELPAGPVDFVPDAVGDVSKAVSGKDFGAGFAEVETAVVGADDRVGGSGGFEFGAVQNAARNDGVGVNQPGGGEGRVRTAFLLAHEEAAERAADFHGRLPEVEQSAPGAEQKRGHNDRHARLEPAGFGGGVEFGTPGHGRAARESGGGHCVSFRVA